MQLSELEGAFAGRTIIRHRGNVFVQSYDPDEASEWRDRGAEVRPVDAAPNFCAEIHLRGLVDPVFDEDEKGDPVDVTNQVLLDHFRTRDGFSWPARDWGS